MCLEPTTCRKSYRRTSEYTYYHEHIENRHGRIVTKTITIFANAVHPTSHICNIESIFRFILFFALLVNSVVASLRLSVLLLWCMCCTTDGHCFYSCWLVCLTTPKIHLLLLPPCTQCMSKCWECCVCKQCNS